jgi:hypothetical protein
MNSGVVDTLKLWVTFIIFPISNTENLLITSPPPNRLSPVIGVWLFTLIIGLAVYEPILNLFGIPWDNVGFHASYGLIFILHILLNASITHVCLKMLGLQSILQETVTIYTIVVIYSPISAFFYLPATYYLYSALHLLKTTNLTLGNLDLDTIRALTEKMRTIQTAEPLRTAISVGNYVGLLVESAALAAYAEFLAKWYGQARDRTYWAVSVGWTLSLIPALTVVGLFKVLTLYSFLP